MVLIKESTNITEESQYESIIAAIGETLQAHMNLKGV